MFTNLLSTIDDKSLNSIWIEVTSFNAVLLLLLAHGANDASDFKSITEFGMAEKGSKQDNNFDPNSF